MGGQAVDHPSPRRCSRMKHWDVLAHTERTAIDHPPCDRQQQQPTTMFLGRVLRGLTALLSITTLAAVPTAAAYPDPIACTGACWAHDPGVVKRADGKYFRFGTGSKIGIWTASSLTGSWTYQGAALPSGSSINLAGNDDLWVCLRVPLRSLGVMREWM